MAFVIPPNPSGDPSEATMGADVKYVLDESSGEVCVEVDIALIDMGGRRGEWFGWTHDQWLLIGVPIPPIKGWKWRAIGNLISIGEARAFLELGERARRQAARNALPNWNPQPVLEGFPYTRD